MFTFQSFSFPCREILSSCCAGWQWAKFLNWNIRSWTLPHEPSAAAWNKDRCSFWSHSLKSKMKSFIWFWNFKLSFALRTYLCKHLYYLLIMGGGFKILQQLKVQNIAWLSQPYSGSMPCPCWHEGFLNRNLNSSQLLLADQNCRLGIHSFLLNCRQHYLGKDLPERLHSVDIVQVCPPVTERTGHSGWWMLSCIHALK